MTYPEERGGPLQLFLVHPDAVAFHHCVQNQSREHRVNGSFLWEMAGRAASRSPEVGSDASACCRHTPPSVPEGPQRWQWARLTLWMESCPCHRGGWARPRSAPQQGLRRGEPDADPRAGHVGIYNIVRAVQSISLQASLLHLVQHLTNGSPVPWQGQSHDFVGRTVPTPTLGVLIAGFKDSTPGPYSYGMQAPPHSCSQEREGLRRAVVPGPGYPAPDNTEDP